MGSGGSKPKNKPSSAPLPSNQNNNAGGEDTQSKQKTITALPPITLPPSTTVTTTSKTLHATTSEATTTVTPREKFAPSLTTISESTASEKQHEKSVPPLATTSEAKESPKEKQKADNFKDTEPNVESPENNTQTNIEKNDTVKNTDTANNDTVKNTDTANNENIEKNKGQKMEKENGKETSVNGSRAKMVETEEDFIPLESEDQRHFDDAISSVCLLVKPDSIMKKITQNVTKLQLPRALPYTFNLYNLLTKMVNLQELDISNNQIGPQGFRSICLALCSNSSILSLNLAGNMSDTDSAESLGKMISSNKSLQYLDVSSNYLGKDYFSRCVGPALKINTSLKTLRAESIGSTDFKLFMEGLQQNTSLAELDISRNGISDRTLLGKGFAECLKHDTCNLATLNLCNCEMDVTGVEAFREGLKLNSSLTELNLGGNEFGSLNNLLKFVAIAANHRMMKTLNLDDAMVKDKSVEADDIKTVENPLSLQSLSLSNDNITDEFLDVLASMFKGRQLPLTDINLNNNGNLTPKCIHSIVDLTSGDDEPSTIRKISYNLNKADGLPSELLAVQMPSLSYLNIRKSKVTDIQQLSQLYTEGRMLTTLVLDGLKLSSTNTLEKLMENAVSGSLTTLSLGGCSLADVDLKPLCQSIKAGLQLYMLKLSANRITDAGVIELVEALLTHKTHPLAVLDISTNGIEDDGAKGLTSLFTNKKHTSKLHSLNVSANSIGKEGILSFMSVIGRKFPLRLLYISDQTKSQEEGDMVDIFNTLASSLGFTVKKQGESIQLGCSDIPVIPEGLVIGLKRLGGNTGEIGRMLDSPRIRTDFTHDQLPTLSFEHCQEICAYLKGTGSDICLWSSEEWKQITGADRPTTDTPSWLQVENSRNLAVYLSNLPGNATLQKMEALFEMEADCNVDEISLMKDPVTRHINGVGWGLLVDQESIQKAVDFFRSGDAFQYNAFLDDFQFQGRKGSAAGCFNAALPLSIMKTKAGAGDTSFFLSILNIKPPELQKKAFQYNAFLDDFQFQGRKGSAAGCFNAALPLSIMKTKAGAGDTSFFLSILNIKPPELQKKAKVFGQAFMISKIRVKIDDEANSQTETKARQELEDRMARMQKEEKAHRVLIQRRAEEQWKRHAYRLAHPAYADGRIW